MQIPCCPLIFGFLYATSFFSNRLVSVQGGFILFSGGDDVLKIEYVDINSIKPYENNAKLHPQYQIEQIKSSIEQIGFKDPIGIWNGEIVEGHGRYLAAKQMGMKDIPVIRLDDLSDEQRRAYALIHNQLTMNSDFDLEILQSELDEIYDIDMDEFDFDLPEENQSKEILSSGLR